MRERMPQSALIEALLNKVADYTNSHPELKAAHHYLFALPYTNTSIDDPIDFVVMGINPGESLEGFKIAPDRGYEESFRSDFHNLPGGPTAGRVAWFKNIEKMLPDSKVLLTELFFWSSRRTGDLEKKFGKLKTNPHLAFCNTINKALLEIVSPKAVVFPGLTYSKLVAKQFEIRKQDSLSCPDTKHRLVERYEQAETPWFFTKHWSGSFGFSDKQRALIKSYIQQHSG